MKKIEAIIRKTKFEEVKAALLSSDINWFEYHDVHGIGQSRQERIYRGHHHCVSRCVPRAHSESDSRSGPYRRDWRWSYFRQRRAGDLFYTYRRKG